MRLSNQTYTTKSHDPTPATDMENIEEEQRYIPLKCDNSGKAKADTSERLLEPMSKESKTTDHREDINLSGDVVSQKDQIINIIKSADILRISQKAVQALTVDEQVNPMELLEEDCEPIEQECSVAIKRRESNLKKSL